MMRQIRLNKKVGLFVLLFIVTLSVACFSVINIFAEDVKNSDKLTDSDGNKYKEMCETKEVILNRYAPDVEVNGDQYIVSLNPEEKKLKKIAFLASKVGTIDENGEYSNWTDITDQGLYVSGNNSLTLLRDGKVIFKLLGDKKAGKEDKLVILLVSDKDPYCDRVELNVELRVNQPTYEQESVKYESTIEGLQEGKYSSTPIDCNNPADESEKLICYAKTHSDSINNKNRKASFTCDSERFYYDTTKIKSSKDDKNSPYEYLDGITFPIDNRNSDTKSTYYVNKKYLYASESHDITANYTYHYNASSEVSKTTQTSCKVTCEEGVVVEYGPPVASKAGLCFQYKIKVTSNVRCYMSAKPEKPTVPGLCTPAPVCVTKAGVAYRQGGPNDDYDSCVKECDGGKYSKKCSKKCYKKVYGNTTSTSKTATSLNSYSTTKLDLNDYSLAACQALNDGGCYLRENGVISWKSNKGSIGSRNSKLTYLEGRWYQTSGWHNTYGTGMGSIYGVFRDDGFYRHDRWNGSEGYCHDNCHWEGCSGDYYLNPGYAQKDYTNNMKIYENLYKQCQAATSCSESTATFAIKVNYSTDEADTEGKWIYFPYSTKNDKESKDKLSSINAKPIENTAKNENSTILSYDGCYEDNKESGKFYQTEWSFPGSWINNKTGEISYKDKSGSKGWRTMPNKFCVPLDARNVNTKWWNYYYTKVMNGTTSSFTEYKDKCFGDANVKGIDKYNIVGETTKFGKFNWDVTVSCFYALNGGNKSDSNVCTNTSKSRVRSVDLENLFPAKDGSKSDQNSVGRKPGFNWSTYASTKNVSEYGMAVDPSVYLTDVQNLGYSIYGNDYLDYEFDLSPSDLKQLRSVTKDSNHNYTSYSGTSTVSDKTGVTRYTMSNNVSKYATKKANDSARECNNMINYQSGQCYVYGSNTN